MAKVFISYGREDASFSNRLYEDLTATGAEPWLDTVKLLPGQRWEDEIKKAISNSDYFLLLFSSNSVGKRGFFQAEVDMALKELDQMPPDRISLIPCRLENVSIPHPRLRDLQWLDFFPSYETAFQKLKLSLGLTAPEEGQIDDYRKLLRDMDQNLLKYKLARINRVAKDPAIIGLPTYLTQLRLRTKRTPRRLQEAIVRLQQQVPMLQWKIELDTDGTYLLRFKHHMPSNEISALLNPGLVAEGIELIDGRTQPNQAPTGHNRAIIGESPDEVSVVTPEGKVLAYIGAAEGILSGEEGGIFDAESHKKLTKEEAEELFKNSNYKIMSDEELEHHNSERARRDPTSRQRLVPLYVWYEPHGVMNLVTEGYISGNSKEGD